jgi:hypothetical protein
MTSQERDLIRRALDLLHRLMPPEEPDAASPVRRDCPVVLFVRRYLVREPGSDLTSKELWTFFAEVSSSGEVEPVSKSEFLSRLPGVMELAFAARKSHNIQRAGRRVRGFRGIGIRMDTCAPAAPELEPERTLLSTPTS